MSPTPLRVLVGALAPGAWAGPTTPGPPAGTLLLDLGPEHPSRAGLLELRLWTEAGLITRADVIVGFQHRGAEKLFEARDYRQILMLADRHDWQAPFFGELLIALLAESMLGVEVPPRAVWLRTLMAEHTRILSHLGFLSFLPYAVGAPDGGPALRERLREQTLALSGNRIHPMLNRIGGLAADADETWLDEESALLADVEAVRRGLATLLDDPRLRASVYGVAPLSAEVCAGYGISGPAARASGLPLDLRLSFDHLSYAELRPLITPTPDTGGDAASRLRGLLHDLAVSARLIDACVARLRTLTGPVALRLGKIIRLPEGEGAFSLEAPLGLAGAYVVSRGEKTPWRLKLRTPSFANVSALESVLIGVRTHQLEAALASIGYVVGDVDR